MALLLHRLCTLLFSLVDMSRLRIYMYAVKHTPDSKTVVPTQNESYLLLLP